MARSRRSSRRRRAKNPGPGGPRTSFPRAWVWSPMRLKTSRGRPRKGMKAQNKRLEMRLKASRRKPATELRKRPSKAMKMPSGPRTRLGKATRRQVRMPSGPRTRLRKAPRRLGTKLRMQPQKAEKRPRRELIGPSKATKPLSRPITRSSNLHALPWCNYLCLFIYVFPFGLWL